MRSRSKTILVSTYTMEKPAAVGVFFRALRLGFELVERGHRVVVANTGPVPDDPKVELARGRLEIRAMPWQEEGLDLRGARTFYRAARPDLVVFGEGPFDTLKMHFRAALGLWAPFVLLDQYYQDWLVTRRRDVDRILLYGLAPFLGDGDFAFDGRYRLVPPFIGEVTPAAALPVREAARGLPWVTVLGFEPAVLAAGLDLVAALPEPRPVVVALAHDPAAARREAAARGLDAERVVAPGLLPDADLFGFMAASRAVVLANGYMQIMESLALAVPCVAVSRGVGLEGWTVEARYKPYVSIGEPPATQRERLAAWLAATPFPPALAANLAGERHGARRVADEIDALLAAPWHPEHLRRRARRVARSYLGRGEG